MIIRGLIEGRCPDSPRRSEAEFPRMIIRGLIEG